VSATRRAREGPGDGAGVGGSRFGGTSLHRSVSPHSLTATAVWAENRQLLAVRMMTLIGHHQLRKLLWAMKPERVLDQ
jgi:hypothetical protein